MKSLPGPSLHSFNLDEGKYSNGYSHCLDVLSDVNRKVNNFCVSFVCAKR